MQVNDIVHATLLAVISRYTDLHTQTAQTSCLKRWNLTDKTTPSMQLMRLAILYVKQFETPVYLEKDAFQWALRHSKIKSLDIPMYNTGFAPLCGSVA